MLHVVPTWYVKERSSSELRSGRGDGRDGVVVEKELFVRLDIVITWFHCN